MIAKTRRAPAVFSGSTKVQRSRVSVSILNRFKMIPPRNLSRIERLKRIWFPLNVGYVSCIDSMPETRCFKQESIQYREVVVCVKVWRTKFQPGPPRVTPLLSVIELLCWVATASETPLEPGEAQSLPRKPHGLVCTAVTEAQPGSLLLTLLVRSHKIAPHQ